MIDTLKCAVTALALLFAGQVQAEILTSKPQQPASGTTAGTFTTIDVPASALTQPLGINPAGAITGYYLSNSLSHGFLWAPDGTFTSFDPPGSQSTLPIAINPAGTITGYYYAGNT